MSRDQAIQCEDLYTVHQRTVRSLERRVATLKGQIADLELRLQNDEEHRRVRREMANVERELETTREALVDIDTTCKHYDDELRRLQRLYDNAKPTPARVRYLREIGRLNAQFAPTRLKQETLSSRERELSERKSQLDDRLSSRSHAVSPRLPDLHTEIINLEGHVQRVKPVKTVERELEMLATKAMSDALPDYARTIGQQRASGLHRLIALEIAERIHTAHLVLAIMTPFADFRTWMDYEMQLAYRIGKRIVGIRAGSGTHARGAAEFCEDVIDPVPARVCDLLKHVR